MDDFNDEEQNKQEFQEDYLYDDGGREIELGAYS